jgi:hypothetical protein
MIGIKVKGKDPKFTCEIVSIYKAPKEDTQVIERLATRTGCVGNSTKPIITGGHLNLSRADWNKN